jgi:hypothetical protein
MARPADHVGAQRKVRWRSSAGFGTVGLAVAVVAATSLALGGFAAHRSGLDFGTGFAWLGSNGENQAVLVNGATGQGTTKVNLDPGGVRLEVRMFGEHAYVVQIGRDGERVLYRLDDADLATGAKRPLAGGQALVRSDNRAWLVDRAAGTVEAVDPETLAGSGRALAFRGPIQSAPDHAGRLVVVEEPTAVAYVIEEDRSEPVPVGSPGDRLAVSSVDEFAVVVNTTRSEVQVFADGVPHHVALPAGPGTLEVAPAGEGDHLVLLRRDGGRGELLLVDLDAHTVRAVAVEGGVSPGMAAPLATREAVFLVDAPAGTIVVIDPSTGRVRQRVPTGLPREAQAESFVKDGRLWVNDPGGVRAIVVSGDGRHHGIDKQDRRIPDANQVVAPDAPAQAPRPDAAPSRQPNPDPGPGSGLAGDGSQPVPGPTPGPAPGPAPGPGPAPIVADPGAPPPIVTAPGAPQQVRALAGDRKVSLSWQPGANGGAPLLGYTLTCTPDCGTGNGVLSLPPGGAYVVENLQNGRDYSFTLVARNQIGESPKALAQPDPVRPTADVPAAPTNVVAVANNDGSVTVNWEMAAGASLSGFAITATSDSPTLTAKTASFTAPAGNRTLQIEPGRLGYDIDATPDWAFEIAATAGTVTGPPAMSNRVDPYRAPAFPGGASLTATPAAGQVTLRWPAAAHNGRPVTYTLARCQGANCNPAGSTQITPNAGANGQLTHVVTGLTNGTAYRFRINVANDAGPGGFLTSGDATPIGRPSLVFGRAETTTNRIEVPFTIQWSGPLGDCDVRRGVVSSTGAGSSEATSCTPTGGVYTSNSAQPGRTYTIQICAVRDGQEGCDSITVTAKQPPTRQIVIDTLTWLPTSKKPDICNGENGAGSQKDPDAFRQHPDQYCRYDGRTYTAVCQTSGYRLTGEAGQSSTRWYKLQQGDYVSAGWVKGNPETLGLPAC